MLEPGPCQLVGQVDVGVSRGFELADQLGDERAAEDHRRVRLLDAEHVDVGDRRQRSGEPRAAWLALRRTVRPWRTRLVSAAAAMACTPSGERHGVEQDAVVEPAMTAPGCTFSAVAASCPVACSTGTA